MNTIDKFNKEVEAINEINGWTSPLEVLSKFQHIRHTLSILQDELIQNSLDTLKVGN